MDATQEGNFHIYTVSTIDEGMTILTGVEAGDKRADGTYPKGTINYNVDKKLREMATKLKEFCGPAEEEKGRHVTKGSSR